MGVVSKAADEKRWDKLKSWASVQEDITHRLQVPEKYDQSMSLYRGPQLYHTLLHPSNIKCMTHFKSSVGEVFATHFRVGTLDQLCVWSLGSRDRDAACTQKRFDINSEIKVLIYIPKHRVYMGFCSDLQMRMFTDAKSKCQEISAIKCQTTMLSLAYNKNTDEVYVGGIGALEKWKITGSEHSAVAKSGKPFQTDLEKHEWVIDIKIDEKNQQMMALSYEGIYVVNCETMKQTHHLQNRHEGSLKCCCFYKEREYFITGGGDGQVKVWNAVVFTQVHVFYGHHNAITGLQVHHTDPLLFSCSMDGSVQIWRMDNFSKFMRVDLGETIHQMKLIGEEEFYCQTEKELRIYSLNQFYNLFAPVESTVYRLQLCPSNKRLGKASRIIASTEDGSVRIFSPLTGLAITIIYPMASFQVLSCFAYNREKEKLQTLLDNGDVLSFNCTTNPCKAEEVWRPATPDEAVTQLALMSLQYKNRKKQTEYDTVVLGGLKNGQVSLLDASNCEMVKNIQAHEGMITCMEICSQIDHSGFQIDDTSQILITGGNDQTIRLWKVEVIAERSSNVVKLHQKLKVKCRYIPSQISMYENTLCVAFEKNSNSKGFLQMYRIEGLLDECDDNVKYTELNNIADENHVKEVTSIDKCPLLGLFASSSTDGYIKIWNHHNQLVREMMFNEPVYGMCFANCRGDILIGFQSHVCSIPLTSYLTQEYLERIVLHHFQDDVRETPIPYNNKLQPWFDPKQLPKFSTSLSKRGLERSSQDTEEEDLAVLEDLEGLKSQVPSKKIKLEIESVEQDQSEQISEEKIKEMAMEILSDQALFEEDDGLVLHSERSEIWKEVTTMLRLEVSRSLEDQRIKFDGKTPPNLDQLTPWERELLKRKPIIPLDGFIPNSVVRKCLGYIKPETPLSLKKKTDVGRWKVKPIPRVDPKHMPAGWIPEYIEEENEDDFDTEPLSWNFIDEDDRSSTAPTPWKKMGMMMRATSNLSTTSSKSEKKPRSSSKRSEPSTPTTRYELKSKKFEFNKFDFDLGPPDRLKSVSRDPSRERSKSFRLTNMVVDEESTDIRFKEGEKSGKRRLFPAVDLDVVHQLLDENWFPDLQGSPSFDSIMSHLMNLLDDTDNQEQHEKVCDYILALHKEIGIPDIYLDRIVSKISNQLGHSKKNIKHDGLRTLKELGGDRQDVLATILPKLIDSQADIRAEAADILASLVGVRDKDDLLQLMESMGISSKYDSKGDEQEALKALAMRLDIPYRTDTFNEWIGNWVDDLSSPGLRDVDDLKLADIDKTWDGREKQKKFPESLHISESNSRASNRLKELSFISDNSGGAFWTPETQASGRRQKSFHLEERRRDSISTTSRESSNYRRRRFDPRNPMVYQYYLKRLGKRTKSGKILKGGVVSEESEEEFVDNIPSKITDIMDVSSVASSQEFLETLSSQVGDGMSTHDSGIGRDISELSSLRRESGKIIPVSSSQYSEKYVSQVRVQKWPSKQDWVPRHQLSPVKSTGALSEISPSPVLQKTIAADWQKFFETPTALERKRLDRVRKEYSKGKLKPVEKPTIRYIADGLPTLPGEAGMRLLHTIKVGDKSQLVDTEGRHRIQSIPGKLMVHTRDENSGMSKYGILQMKWTTGVPCSMTRDYDDFSSKSGTCTPTTVASTMTARSSVSRLDGSKLPELQKGKKVSRSMIKHIRSDESVLPTIDSSGPYSPDFEWEHPLPPPPAKDSRTNVAYIKKQHDYYCKYYNLAKKNMQRDISKRECRLPDIVVKHALNKSVPAPTLQKSLSKLSRTHSIIFPPITLAQLINT